MSKKILAIIGSEKRKGKSTTAELAQLLIDNISKLYPDIDAEIIVMGEQNISFCKGCMACSKTGQCSTEDAYFEFENKIWQSRGWYKLSFSKILATKN